MSVLVECNCWGDDEIEMSRFDQYAPCRCPDSEVSSFKLSAGCDFAKQHFCTPAQNRHENALVCAPRSLDDFTRIYFIVHRQVTADGIAGVELTGLNDSLANNS